MRTLENLAEFWSMEGLQHIIPDTGNEFPEGFDVREMLKQIIDPTGGVIEIGCGYGRLCRAFPAELYIGFDVNPSAIEVARARNPGYRFEHVSPAAELPKNNTALAYTVACHIPDEELKRFFAPVCAAAPTVVVAEIMDSRWRRPGNPPIFNRDPEHYIMTMARMGFMLRTCTKTNYARYDTSPWNVGRDTRLTVHVYARQSKP